MTFLTDEVMAGTDWRGLELAVVRLLSHCGWKNVQDVGKSGDKGADILAVHPGVKNRKSDTYLIQVKAISGGSYVGITAINQALQGQGHYKTRVTVVATNGDFTKSALKRRDELREEGFDVRLWNGAFLTKLLENWPQYPSDRKEPRSYQDKIVQKILSNFDNGRGKSLFIVATGLGKTVIASTASNLLMAQGLKKILVLCHSTDLAQQLQKEFWNQIPKSVPTRIFMDGDAPIPVDGINFGLYQTLHGYLGGIDSDAFDLVIVDEAHHALANAFATCMEHLKPKFLIGMTATPWRGDGALIDSIFGDPIYRVSLVDGMKMGYLSRVDYRLICDNINWEEIPKLAKKTVSVRDLNKRLFLPQRDDAVVKNLMTVMKEFSNPRIAIFSPSISHAESFARQLNARRIPAANASISDKIKRRSILMDFTVGRLTALTSVDVLNEGIDVPDLNILVFLRATHSRRIFVQQLGRGLRLALGKDKVVVLDYVTDIRRLAAVAGLDREAKEERKTGEIETVYLSDGVVSFSDKRTQGFVDAWLEDVASLEDTEEAEKLTFPEAFS
ncbi:MAG: DEAD/DEAH box helicase family protein [Planctomycetaceae bacterium]|nr:DEAD/DEAH box helicase family protein [Planctomycetaceae bacterium]